MCVCFCFYVGVCVRAWGCIKNLLSKKDFLALKACCSPSSSSSSIRIAYATTYFLRARNRLKNANAKEERMHCISFHCITHRMNELSAVNEARAAANNVVQLKLPRHWSYIVIIMIFKRANEGKKWHMHTRHRSSDP